MNICCVFCGKKLEAPDNAIGKRGKCPRCGEIFDIQSFDPVPSVETVDSRIKFTCSKCAKQYSVSKRLANKKIVCPNCKKVDWI
jgi:phage FluMu protein Com